MTAATRYAKALFELSENANLTGTLQAPLAELKSALEEQDLTHVLANPNHTPAQRAAFAASLSKALKAPPILANLLGLLAQHNRLPLLPEIIDAFQLRAEEKSGITRLHVQTAEPLTEAQRAKLKAMVLKFTGGTDVIVRETQNADLIAGFRASFAGRVWDTSLSTGLARARAALTKRSQHTI